MAGNNNATTRKRKFGEFKKMENPNKSDMMFSQRQMSLFNKVTELSVLYKAKIALIIASPDNKLYTCGYPNCDAVVQQFLTGKDIVKDSEKKKQEEMVETLRLEYEAIEYKLMELKEEEKKFQAINDEVEKSGSVFRWWNISINDMDLESLQEFKASLENLKLNLGSTMDQKKLIFTSNN